jgi:hypothetical protein
LKDPKQVDAEIEILDFSLAYQSLQIANASPIRIGYRGGTATLQTAEFKGTDTDLRLQATVPIESPGALHADANGTVDLDLIKIFNPQYESSGKIILNVVAEGNRAHPDVRGTIRVDDVSMQSRDLPLGIEKMNGELEAAKGRGGEEPLRPGGRRHRERAGFCYLPARRAVQP